MMRTYGPAEGFLFDHSYMYGACGSISTQYAVRRVENLLGLRVTEVNVAVNDVFFP